MNTVKSQKELTPTKSTTTISKILEILFIIIQILFSYDFGFIKYKSTRQKIIIKLSLLVLPTFVGIPYIILLWFCSDLALFLWYSSFIIEYYANIIILLIIPERKNFYNFLKHLLWFDSEVNEKPSYRLEVKILLFCMITITYKILIAFIICISLDQDFINLLRLILDTMTFIPLDIPHIIYYIIFRAVNARLVNLRKALDNRNLELNEAQFLYRSLIDSVENIKNTFDPIFIVTLITNILNMMVVTYLIIKYSKLGSEQFLLLGVAGTLAASFVVTAFAPAIAAGLLSTEVDKIKITLNDMLIVENDDDTIQDIRRFISYMEARPFKFRVLKIIPLDETFPVVMLNLCVTYLIVSLQMTHIY